MSSNSRLLLILVVLPLFLLPVFISRVGASSEEMATVAITQAEETVASAYEAVLEAEQAKANVSVLLNQLNVAGEYLAEARMLYRLGDFDGAVHFADTARDRAEEVGGLAEELKIDAYASGITSSLIRITGSVIGVIGVVIGTFTAWGVFKRHYFRQA